MAEVVTKRHPIRAGLWGLLIGLGLVIWFTFAQPVIGLDSLSSVLIKWGVVILGGVVLAVVLALVLPAKRPKGPPPNATAAAATSPGAQVPDSAPATGEVAASGVADAAQTSDPDDGPPDESG